MKKKNKGTVTEQEFRRLTNEELLKMFHSKGPKLDRLAARTVLMERGYKLDYPVI